MTTIAWTVLAFALAVPGPQRDQPAATREHAGTAVVAGVVTRSAASDTPVRKAIVSLVAADGSETYSLVTDDEGRFAFQAVRSGRYMLTAAKAAHLSNSYGAKRPGRPGTSILLSDGQVLTDVRITLPRGGVVTGTVALPTGEPLADTKVMAISLSRPAGKDRDQNSIEFTTDDRGVYRIYGLLPGEYLIGALPSIGQGPIELRSDADYDAAVQALRQRRGQPGVAPVPAPATPQGEPALVGYAPTYYPDTPIAANAVRVRVEEGAISEGVDITATMFRMSTITGTLTGTDGRPVSAAEIITEGAHTPLGLASSLPTRRSAPDAQGRFTVTNVPPGAYRLTARSGGITVNPGGSGQTLSTDAQTEWATATIYASGDNIDNVALRLQAGLTFEGTLTLAGAAPGSWKGARVSLQPTRSGTSGRSAVVADTGTFRVTGLQPGLYDVTVSLPAGLDGTWAVRSMLAGAQEVRDQPLTFEQGSVTDVVITLTAQRTEVTGTLTSASGTPAPDYYVVIFSADRALWHPTSPRTQVVRPGADGVFRARDLPAGAYRLVALTDIDEDEWRTGAFLESVMPASIPLLVKEGETTRQDVRVVPAAAREAPLASLAAGIKDVVLELQLPAQRDHEAVDDDGGEQQHRHD